MNCPCCKQPLKSGSKDSRFAGCYTRGCEFYDAYMTKTQWAKIAAWSTAPQMFLALHNLSAYVLELTPAPSSVYMGPAMLALQAFKDKSHSDDKAQLLSLNHKLIQAAQRLYDAARIANDHQHAGQEVEADIWSEMYAAQNAFKAALEAYEEAI